MKALWFSGLVAVTLLMGCGRSVPIIESPADGAQYSIQAGTPIQVTIANQDYQDVQIAWRGTEAVPEYQFLPGNGGMATAYKSGNAASFGQCTKQRPCTVFIIVTRGDQKDFRTISLIP